MFHLDLMIHVYRYNWNPNGAPCFDWNLDLVVEGFF